MQGKKYGFAVASLLALGAYAPSAEAAQIQYDQAVTIATLACPSGSTGYDNARFMAFPFFTNTVPNWRLTVWCSAGGTGRRGHFEPGTGGLFTTWNYAGGSFGVGWPAPAAYGNQFQQIDVDGDGDLDILQMIETSVNTWSVFLLRARG
ncbi:MAG TPA: hypothetical protein VE153_20815 [Myxococcus sp.]|jgi:hypothetical protein|nr:hypothetical protein [Myxococcus sp.]